MVDKVKQEQEGRRETEFPLWLTKRISFDLNMNQVTHGMIITNATNAKDGGADRTY